MAESSLNNDKHTRSRPRTWSALRRSLAPSFFNALDVAGKELLLFGVYAVCIILEYLLMELVEWCARKEMLHFSCAELTIQLVKAFAAILTAIICFYHVLRSLWAQVHFKEVIEG